MNHFKFKTKKDIENGKLISMTAEKKNRLLGAFTEDISYIYHLNKVEGGFLIYFKKADAPNNIDTFDFSANAMGEELLSKTEVKVEKVSSSIFFTPETNSKNIKKKLNTQMGSNKVFGEFIDGIKDEYKKLEIADFLLMKKDPEAYEEARRKEYVEHQIDLANKYSEQLKREASAREKMIMSYNNDFKRLFKEIIAESIYLDREGFDLDAKMYHIIQSIAEPTSWVKKDGQPFMGSIGIIDINADKMNIRISDSVTTHTATLRFDKAEFITESSQEELMGILSVPVMTDYELLSFLYDITINDPEWQFKNKRERFLMVIEEAIKIVEAENEKERTAVGVGKKYVGISIDKKNHETANKFHFTDDDWDLKYEEFSESGKNKYDAIIEERIKKLVRNSIPHATFRDEFQDIVFVNAEDEHFLQYIFPEFERNGFNDEIFDLITFQFDTLVKDQPYTAAIATTDVESDMAETEALVDAGNLISKCGGDCDGNCKTGNSECECGDPNCKCKNPDNDEVIDDDTITSVVCEHCDNPEPVFSFTINKKIHICMDITEKSISIDDENNVIKTVAQLKKYLSTEPIKVTNIIAECGCVEDEVAAIVSMGRKKFIDYTMFAEDKIIYGEYLLTKLKNNF